MRNIALSANTIKSTISQQMGNFLSSLFMAFVKECLRDAEIDRAPTRERREA